MRIKEVSEITGVSVRNLQYYDDEGLVCPGRDSNGYRDYDEQDLERLQQVLVFKYLRMELADIKKIMNSPGYDSLEVLEKQIHVLQEEKERLEYLIMYAEIAKQIGTGWASFELLHDDRLTEFVKEVMRSPRYSELVNQDFRTSRKLMSEYHEIAEQFGQVKSSEPESDEAQAAVERLSEWLGNFCGRDTPLPQVLLSCVVIFSSDGGIARQIDEIGGKGTAEFVADAANRKYILDFIDGIEPVYELLSERIGCELSDQKTEEAARELLAYMHRFLGSEFLHQDDFLKLSEELIRNCLLAVCEEDPDLIDDKKIIEFALEVLSYYGSKENHEGEKKYDGKDISE